MYAEVHSNVCGWIISHNATTAHKYYSCAVQTLASPPASAYLADYPLAGSQQQEADSGEDLSRGGDTVDAGSSTSAISEASGSGGSGGKLATGEIVGVVIGVAALAVAATAAAVIASMKYRREIENLDDEKVRLLHAMCWASALADVLREWHADSASHIQKQAEGM